MKILQTMNDNPRVNNAEQKSRKKNEISNGFLGPVESSLTEKAKCSGRKNSEKMSRSSPSKTSPTKVTNPNSTHRASKTKNKKELSMKCPKKFLKCRHCHFSCIKRPELKLHLKSKHKNASNDLINGNFKTNVQITRQNLLHGFKCGSCKFCAKSRKDLRNHFRLKHSSDEENFPEYGLPVEEKSCQFCSSTFGCVKELNYHVRTSHNDRLRYKCDKCNFGSNFHAGLAYHVKTKHSTANDVVFKSDFVVDEIFDEKPSVENEKSSSKASLKCRHCAFVGKTSTQLDRHKKAKHSNLSEDSFVHDEVIDAADLTLVETLKKSRKCSKAAETSQLNDITNDAKKFKCKSCDYDAKTKSTLNCHFRRIHLGIRDQICQYCSYKAGNKSDLTKHINGVHLKRKDFKCKSCSYSCALSSTLIQHVRAVHLKIKNHICPECDYKTSFGGDLMKHIRSKHSENSVAVLKKLKQRKMKKRDDGIKVDVHHKTAMTPAKVVDASVLVNATTGLICDFCDFKCRFKKSFLKHLKSKHRVNRGGETVAPPGHDGLPQKVHLKENSSEELTSCSHCDFKTTRKTVLDRHLTAKHQKIQNGFHNEYTCSSKLENCPHCKYLAADKTDLANHVKETHPKLVKNLLRKMKEEFEGTTNKTDEISSDFKCPGCSFRANKFNLIIQHIKKSHQKASGDLLRQLRMIKRFACPECSMKSRFKVNISRHLSKLHPGSRAKVVVIDTTANKSANIPRREKNFDNQKKLVRKDDAPNETKSKPVVKGNQAFEDGDDAEVEKTIKIQLSCSKCSFVAKNHPDLISHFDKSHLKRGSGDRRCPHCNYRTTLSVLLNSHVVTSHSKNVKNSTAILNVRQLFM